MIPFFVLPFTLLVGAGELYRRRLPFVASFCCADCRSIRIGGERERPLTSSPVMTKSRGPSWEQNNYAENGLVSPPGRKTRALGPAGIFGEKVPPRLVAQKSRSH